ncbi:MAG: elongation factor P [Patescibacteria group bacterium]
MLSYNEILPKKVIVIDGVPYEVLTSWIFRKQMRKPVNQTKLRNLKTGGTIEYTFHQPDKAEEADLEKHVIQFIYTRNDEYWFMDPKDAKNRFALPDTLVGEAGKYLKKDMLIDAVSFEEEIIKLKLPIKVDLLVTEAPPNFKGDTAQGAVKQVVLETGATITAPMFIEAGEVIRINTETNEYVERAK